MANSKTMTSRLPKLWLLIMFCLNPAQINETESRPQSSWRRGATRMSRSTMLLQRPMRSLTHTARCRRYIYSPECRGIMSKRSTIQMPQRNTVDFGKNIFLRKKESLTEQNKSQSREHGSLVMSKRKLTSEFKNWRPTKSIYLN